LKNKIIGIRFSHRSPTRWLLRNPSFGGADKTADVNSRAVLIVVSAFDDLAVHRDAGLVGKVAFSVGSGYSGRRKPVGFAVAKPVTR
jgi:hypothetical protein